MTKILKKTITNNQNCQINFIRKISSSASNKKTLYICPYLHPYILTRANTRGWGVKTHLIKTLILATINHN